jgi:hypothetical protein
MANEFKIKKGLIVTGASGGTALDVQGSQGQLFSVTDDLSGSIFAVSDISGVPILDVNSSGLVTIDGSLTSNGVITAPTFQGDLNGTINTATIGTTQTAGNNSTLIATTAYADAAAGAVPIGNYLPLTGGTLTGALSGTSANFTGSLNVGENPSTGEKHVTVGNGRTGNGYSYIDLVGDATYTDYGLRIIRGNSGENTNSSIIHRGTGNLVVQSTDAGNVVLATSGTERMRINSSGNVGIGTTSPVNKLDVYLGSSGVVANFNGVNAYGAETGITLSQGRAKISGFLNTSGATPGSNLRFYTMPDNGSVTERMRITSGGNIGIGTTSPDSKLHVESNLATGANFILESTHTGGIPLLDLKGAHSAQLRYKDELDVIQGRIDFGDSGAFNFIDVPNNSSTLYLEAGGNVGIGTTNPSHLLNLSESDSNSVQLVIDNTNTTDAGTETSEIRFRHYRSYVPGQNDSGEIIVGKEQAWDSAGDRNSYMAFGTRKGSDAVVEKMRITSSGNVGIGTTSPGAKLTVQTSFTNSASDSYIEINSGHEASGGSDVTGVAGLLFKQAGSGNVLRSAGSIVSGREGNYSATSVADSYLAFSTAQNSVNAERMRITSAGNVGIGTTSPSHKLEVGLTSSVALASQPAIPLMISNDGNSVDGRVLLQVKHDVVNTAGAIAAGYQMTAAAVTSGTASYYNSLIFLESAGSGSETVHSAPKNIEFYTNNSATAAGAGTSYTDLGDLAFELQADGDAIFYDNVGIGTTSPQQKLHIVDTDGANIILNSNTGAENNGIWMTEGGIASPYANGAYVHYDSTNNAFKINTGTTSLTTKLTIERDSGNVGIGTTTFPTTDIGERELLVQGAIVSKPPGVDDYYSYLKSNWAADSAFELGIQGADVNHKFITSSNYYHGTHLNLWTSDQKRMVIDSAGNVGIGTTSPGYLLDLSKTAVSVDTYSGINLQASNYGYTIEGGLTQNIGGELIFSSNNVGTRVPRVKFAANGNVGIGTTTPNAKLDVQGTQGQLFSVTDDLSGDIFSVADISGVPIMNVNSDGTSYLDGKVYINATASIPNRTEEFQVTGRQIITNTGTDGPSLDLGYNSSGSVRLQLGRGRTADGLAYMDFNGEVMPAGSYGFRIIRNSGANAVTQLNQVGTGNLQINASNGADTVFTNTDVGIGTTSPGAKLDVSDTTTGVGAIIGNTTHNSRLQIYTAAASKNSEIWFGDAADADVGKIDYDHANNSLAFTTNTSERMRINSNGNVGIGTTSPGQDLHINDADGNSLIRFSGGAANNETYDIGQGIAAVSNGGFGFRNITENKYVMVFQDNTGNVGIGTTTPLAKLAVIGDVHVGDIYTPSDKSLKLRTQGGLFEITTYNTATAGTAIKYSWGTGGQGPLTINNAVGEVMRLDGGGNVGIGTASPVAPLHIAKATTTATDPLLKLERISPVVDYQDLNSSGYFYLKENFKNSSSTVIGSREVWQNPGGSGLYYNFDNGGSGGSQHRQKQNSFHWTINSNSEKLTLGTNGYLGVNDTSPSYQLDVNGSGRFTSTVTATNFILSSDERLKENIEKVCDNRVKADWKTFELKADKGQRRYGVIAQELEKTNPEFVREDVDGFKSVAYIDLLIAKIAELEARLEKLEK